VKLAAPTSMTWPRGGISLGNVQTAFTEPLMSDDVTWPASQLTLRLQRTHRAAPDVTTPAREWFAQG
jgi:hypothetical protein